MKLNKSDILCMLNTVPLMKTPYTLYVYCTVLKPPSQKSLDLSLHVEMIHGENSAFMSPIYAANLLHMCAAATHAIKKG